MKQLNFLILFLVLAVFIPPAEAQKKNAVAPTGIKGKTMNKMSAYLFVYFTGNRKEEEAIRFALSRDGFNYRALNHNRPVIASEKITSTGGVRDPHILRGHDGKTFYMVVTDMVSANGWSSNRAMVLLKSTDLLHWSSSVVNIQKRFNGQDSLLRVWAPQTIYDPVQKKYMIYWSMKHGQGPDIIYYAYANPDFTDLETEPRQLFYHPQNLSCIDGDIVHANGKYHLFFKTEGHGNGIKKAVSDKLTSGYVMQDRYLQQTSEAVEGAGTFPLTGTGSWILMYDVYMKGSYQFTRTRDLENFSVVDDAVTMNFHPRHGTVIPITETEAARLFSRWGSEEEVFLSTQSAEVKTNNIAVDTVAGKVLLPLKPGTNLEAFEPRFQNLPGVKAVKLNGPDFSKGMARYRVSIQGRKPKNFEVQVKEYHNPVLHGYYADPDILYSEKTGRFYIYPTSDGFTGWSGTYFKAFSSADLVEWKDEGVILDLPKDVSWAKRNAWAPGIIEKKVNGRYQYFYYFTAAQKIGVAIADSPTGPFMDSGQPLIDKYPEGISRGQQIDPDVFTDPKTGKSYLFWGNGYLAGAELADDMLSLKKETVKILTPDRSFREGVHVLYRNGLYYFMWSENDTRHPDYRVRYGTSDHPLSKISIPEQNLVLAKDTSAGIFGTGHHSVIKIPGKDEYYIVYHRFTYPKGITMGPAAGYNREVCIDPLLFDKDGKMLPVKPTHEGVRAVTLKPERN